MFARDVYTYLHALAVAGVIVSAAALEEITLHPGDTLPSEFRVMLAVGLGLYFASIESAAFRAFRIVPPERAVAMLAAGAVLLVGGDLHGLWLLASIDAIVLVALVVETRRVERPSVS